MLGYGDTTTRGTAVTFAVAGLPAVDLGRALCSVSTRNNCALLDTDEVKCWGWNNQEQLGLGYTANRGDGANELGDSLPVVDLGTGRRAIQVSVATYHSCALLGNRSVKCWRYNINGQLGLEDTANRDDGPNELGDNLPVVDVGTGRYAMSINSYSDNVCALLWSWTTAASNDGGKRRMGSWSMKTRNSEATRRRVWAAASGAKQMGENLGAVTNTSSSTCSLNATRAAPTTTEAGSPGDPSVAGQCECLLGSRLPSDATSLGSTLTTPAPTPPAPTTSSASAGTTPAPGTASHRALAKVTVTGETEAGLDAGEQAALVAALADVMGLSTGDVQVTAIATAGSVLAVEGVGCPSASSIVALLEVAARVQHAALSVLDACSLPYTPALPEPISGVSASIGVSRDDWRACLRAQGQQRSIRFTINRRGGGDRRRGSGNVQAPWVLQFTLVPAAQSGLIALGALVEALLQSGDLETELGDRGVAASLTLALSVRGEGAELPQPIANMGARGRRRVRPLHHKLSSPRNG